MLARSDGNKLDIGSIVSSCSDSGANQLSFIVQVGRPWSSSRSPLDIQMI